MEHDTTPDAPSASPDTETTTDQRDAADSEANNPDQPTEAPRRSFDDMDLEPEIRKALAEMGYEQPMEVQSAVYESVVTGRDVMVQSRTGSGKTAAFGIPIAQMIDADSSGAQILCLAPTRELALQVSREVEQISRYKGLRVVPVYGGAPMKPQVDALQGGAQIVAGTPGRVLDHIRRGTFVTDKIRFLVLDECDEMLSMGFQEEIEKILDTLPDQRQSLLFSATIPDGIQRIARRYMTDPVEVSLSEGNISVDEIDHHYYVVSGMARTRDLLKVLKAENPESAIIFCNTREDTGTVAKFLRRHGYDAEPISSDLTQNDRERVMKRMRDRNLRFLVATDVAARGIDISDLSHVINYTFPESPEVYVHRTGRTGRAGKRGVAISLVGPREIGAFYYLKLIYKIRPEERQLPSSEELAAAREGELCEKVIGMVSEDPGEEHRALARRLWQSSEGERVVGALIRRLLEDRRRPAQTAPAARPEPSQPAEDAADRETSAPAEGRERKRRRRRRGEDGERDEARRSRGGRQRAEAREAGAAEERPRRRRRRDEGPERDSDVLEAQDVDKAPVEAREAPGGADGGDTPDAREPAAVEGAEGRSASGAEGAEDRSASAEGAEDRPRKRRRRRRRGSKEGAGETSARAPLADPSKEFWETWAEEKSTRDEGAAEQDERGGDEDGGKAGNGDSRRKSTARLYLNLGKREDVTADEVRDLLREDLEAEEAEKVGSVALRNTHCYVRVPEELADKIIELTSGKSYKDREIQIERARR